MENTSAKLNISMSLKIHCYLAAQRRSKRILEAQIFTLTWPPRWNLSKRAQNFSLWTLQTASDHTSSCSKGLATGRKPSFKSAKWVSKTHCHYRRAMVFSEWYLALSWWVRFPTNLLRREPATTRTEVRTLWPSIGRRIGAETTTRKNMKEPAESVLALKLAQIVWINCFRQDPCYTEWADRALEG